MTDGDGFQKWARGGGHVFKPIIPLNELDWFPEFFRMMAHFSLGVHELKDERLIATLRALSLEFGYSVPAKLRFSQRYSTSSQDRSMEPSWKQADVFPIIVRLIGQAFSQHQDYVTSRELSERLVQDSGAQILIEAARRELDQQRSAEWLASNMVAWFGQRITVGESDWSRHVERIKVDGNWAYRPAS